MTQEQALSLVGRLWKALQARQDEILAEAAKIDTFLNEHPPMRKQLAQATGQGTIPDGTTDDDLIEYMAKAAPASVCLYWNTFLALHRLVLGTGVWVPLHDFIAAMTVAAGLGYYRAVQDLLNEEIVI